MNRSPCWTFFVLVAIFALTESRRYHLVSYDRGGAQRPSAASGSVQSHFPSQQQGARATAVLVRCHPDSMELVVQADLFDTGFLVDPEHLRLGSDPASGSGLCRAGRTGDDWTLTIWANLLDCGTLLSSTQDKIIYSNVLVYSPEPSSEGLFRLDGVTIPVACHFDKSYSVASMSLRPGWVPSVSVVSADNRIDFKLRLMTDNWQFERRSHAYFVGDPMHFEVSAVVRKHKPLRVYVERCVATAGPDPRAALRYDFIERNGCLFDAFLTNSSSHFLSRVEGHMLQFQLEAFMFHQQPNSQVYITCWLRAVPDSSWVRSQNRACSFIDNRAHRCRPALCPDDQDCCPRGNSTACCDSLEETTYYHVAMVTRKLSGVLIMLLLFALGYLVQCVLCSRSRPLNPDHGAHPAVTTSQELLVESSTPDSLLEGRTTAHLPTYEQCKHLPTYEETVRYGQPQSSAGQTT
ncbi:zona pellucida sperm-binding protein 3-like [Phycodurus eques]|uniref:zona pellucida sperm-binding protein 3-like n=1 Tax=Phycodurus eques TaxID=693459 RepID=UPI002ACEE0C0|nr:zona pellucida sperm-binding protein 3-like [Phycodurus eques]